MNKKNKVLVFGGSGFLGSHLCDLLIQKKFKVTIYDIKKNNFNKDYHKFIKGNIADKKKIFNTVKKFNYIFNFAGISDIEEANQNPIETINQNFLGTVNILESIKNQKNLKRFIFASSIYATSSQGEFYSSTKRSCENIIENYSKKYGLKFSILRYGSIYGTRANSLNAIHDFILQGIKNNKITRKGLGNEIRSYINVKDAAKITYEILNKKYENKYINIIGKDKNKVKEVLKIISKKLKIKKIIFKKKIKLKYHYSKNPYNYKINKGITKFLSKPIQLKSGIDEIINEIKKT
jgi:UDP-glucose 4-epimerase